jgi:hypothetical protein
VPCRDLQTLHCSMLFGTYFDFVVGRKHVPAPLPPPPGADDVYCPTIMASDSSDHVAIAVEDISLVDGLGGFSLATYTGDSNGESQNEQYSCEHGADLAESPRFSPVIR